MEHSVWLAYRDQGVEVWGIASREQATAVSNYATSLGLSYPILLDEDGSVIARYSQKMAFPTGAYPQDWVIGSDGTIVYANNRFELAELLNALERALAE